MGSDGKEMYKKARYAPAKLLFCLLNLLLFDVLVAVAVAVPKAPCYRQHRPIPF